MARVVMIHNQPTLKMADTQAALTAGKAFECQVTSAVVAATANPQEIPPTGCAGKSSSNGLSSYVLNIDWLQDWSAGAALSLSSYAMTNDGQLKWVEFVPDKNMATLKFQFQVSVAAGNIGGTFGDGSPGVSSATWPLQNAPTPSIPAVELADTDAVAEPVPA